MPKSAATGAETKLWVPVAKRSVQPALRRSSTRASASGFTAGRITSSMNASPALADLARERGWATIELFPKEGAHV